MDGCETPPRRSPQALHDCAVDTLNFATQSPHPVRFEWGRQGVLNVANAGGVTVIVDVFSFSTCVDIACGRGAQVIPYRYKDATDEAYARANSAVLAGARSGGGWSLSPRSLTTIAPNKRLVLPSPNGAALTLACTTPVILAGCLRNASAVAAFAARQPGTITVVAAGEQWENGELRPAVEDLLGAGAIIRCLQTPKSAEAWVAEAAFVGSRGQLAKIIGSCASAIELIDRGFAADIALATDADVSRCVPRLVGGAYVRVDDQQLLCTKPLRTNSP